MKISNTALRKKRAEKKARAKAVLANIKAEQEKEAKKAFAKTKKADKKKVDGTKG